MTFDAGSVVGNDIPQAPVVVSVASSDVVVNQPLSTLNVPVQPLKSSSDGSGQSDTAVPEPSILLLFGMGLIGVIALLRRKKRLDE
jgi:hypothetical protein